MVIIMYHKNIICLIIFTKKKFCNTTTAPSSGYFTKTLVLLKFWIESSLLNLPPLLNFKIEINTTVLPSF